MAIFDDIVAHQRAYNERLYLVASENSPSLNARMAFLTDVLNRYYFPLKEYRHWAFPGNEFMEKIYERCAALLRKATGAQFVNVRPISGVNAMTIALASLGKSGETIATVAPANGGHAITAAVARRLGMKTAYLPYHQEKFKVDTKSLPSFIDREKISLIYLDQCHILFPYNLEEIRSALPERVKIYYDGSHVMGLIFGNNFQRPLEEGATFLGGSTHKTIPGPHKGFIATNDAQAFEHVKAGSSALVSHDHGADIAALAIVLEEMEHRWTEYAEQVVRNAQTFAASLAEKSFSIAAEAFGFTKSHQVWVDIQPFMDPFDAAMKLASSNIIVNTIHAPVFTGRLSLRLGVQEMTYLGARESDMKEIAEIFEMIFIKKSLEKEVKGRVAEIKKRFLPKVDKDHLHALLKSFQA